MEPLPFRVEYTPRDAPGRCKTCKQKFIHQRLRLAEMILANHHDAEVPYWYHRRCFFECHQVKSTDEIEHFERLKYVDQRWVQESVEIKFKDESVEKNIKEQTEKLLRTRERLRKDCSIEEIKSILKENGSSEMDGYNNNLDRCVDFLVFGALIKCSKCQKGDMIFTKHGYTCKGTKVDDEWVKCKNFEERPRRRRCLIPDELEDNPFLSDFTPKVGNRAVRKRVLKKEDFTRTVAPQPANVATLGIDKKEAEIHFKRGTVVDPKSGLSKTTHVYKYKGTLFSSTLTRTDIEKNKNSFFKLQILESDRNQAEKKYWLFTSWGRIGTDREGCKVEPFGDSAIKACEKFKELFKDKTGNYWSSHKHFKKLSDKYFPVDVDYSDVVKPNTTIASRLSNQVEELMKLIFSVSTMNRTMHHYKLDLEKMPLGKLSSKQLVDALTALNELKQAINKKSSEEILVGLSNKFYSLVPHSFGLDKAPVIDSNQSVDKKVDMVVSLQKIQQAYAIMLRSGNADVNSFDAYYKRLNAEIKWVNPKSYGYELIKRYVENTTVHNGMKLSILEVFSVKRNGEKKRYKPFSNLSNRMLLWHGSAITNFASILSNGFKISPAAHGSMFGRGLYFADMVSKSVGYCHAAPPDNTILLALSEIALGKMHELTQASPGLMQAPPGTNSVKGVGKTQPDFQKAHIRKDRVIIPLGMPQTTTLSYNLAFNEYIVYNEAQINIQYLVKMKIG